MRESSWKNVKCFQSQVRDTRAECVERMVLRTIDRQSIKTYIGLCHSLKTLILGYDQMEMFWSKVTGITFITCKIYDVILHE